MKSLLVISLFFLFVLEGCKNNSTSPNEQHPKDGEFSIQNDHISAPNATIYINGKSYNAEANIAKGDVGIMIKKDSVYFIYNDGKDTLTQISRQNSTSAFLKLFIDYYKNDIFLSKYSSNTLDDFNFQTGIFAKQIAEHEYEFYNNKARWSGVEVDNQQPFLMESNEVLPEISVASAIGIIINVAVKKNPQLNVSYYIKTYGSPLKAFIIINPTQYINLLNSGAVSSLQTAMQKNPEFMKRVIFADALSMCFTTARRIIKTVLSPSGYCDDLISETILTPLEAVAWSLVSSQSQSEFDAAKYQVMNSTKEIIGANIECVAQAICTGSTEGACQVLSGIAKAIEEIAVNDVIYIINTTAGIYDATYSLSYDEKIFSSIANSFVVTANKYTETDNLDQAVIDEFGNNYRIADWNDVVSYCQNNSVEQFNNLISWKYQDNLIVTRDNTHYWSNTNRHYFITRFDHNLQSNYLSHANIDNHYIDLGSWYGLRLPILCFKKD